MFTPCRLIFGASGRSFWKSVVLARWIFSNAKTQRWSGLRVFPAPAKMQCTASSWGIANSHYPCVRVFPDCLPYSLYINVSKKEDLRGDWPFFEDAQLTAPIGIPRLFNQTLYLSFRDCGGMGVSTYQWSFSAFTYRPSGLPAILTDGSVV